MKNSLKSGGLLQPLPVSPKTIVVYCSIVPHHTPPFSWYNSAQKLSERIPIIFIDLNAFPQRTGLPGRVRYCKWFVQSILSHKNFLLWSFSSSLSSVFLFLYLLSLKHLLRYRIVLFTNMPETYQIYNSIPYDISCFECTDQYYATQFSENRTQIEQFDMVFTNSKLLHKLMKSFTPKVRRISSGYSEDLKVVKSRIPKITNSIIYSGGISHRIDYRLLEALAILLPNYQFFFMGEMYLNKYYIDEEKDDRSLQEWKQLLRLPNVHYLGAFSSEQTVRLLPLFEVGIIPYDITDVMNYHSHPVKLYEYLAAGIPVVSTSLPSVLEYVDRVPVLAADTAHRMAETLRRLRSLHPLPKNAENIQRVLNEQSVERKAKQIINWIREAPC